METLGKKELGWFKPDPNQPRKEFDLAELAALEESLFVRQDIPLVALVDGTILDGERRWRAAELKGRIKTLDVVITDKPMTPTDLRVFQITSSVHRASLTAMKCGKPASICWPSTRISNSRTWRPTSRLRPVRSHAI